MEWITALDTKFNAAFFVALFTVLNPIHAVPLYLAMVPRPTREQNLQVARVAAATVLTTLLISLFFGSALLRFFGITIYAFQTGSGIVISILALSMLQGRTSGLKFVPKEGTEVAHWASVAVVPLGVPILAGAGAISTVILFSHHARHWPDWAGMLLSILANSLLCYVTLRTSRGLKRALGETGINIISRLMGLLLLGLAVQFVADGANGLFPGLSSR